MSRDRDKPQRDEIARFFAEKGADLLVDIRSRETPVRFVEVYYAEDEPTESLSRWIDHTIRIVWERYLDEDVRVRLHAIPLTEEGIQEIKPKRLSSEETFPVVAERNYDPGHVELLRRYIRELTSSRDLFAVLPDDLPPSIYYVCTHPQNLYLRIPSQPDSE